MSCTFNANSTVIADNKTHSPNPVAKKQETSISLGRRFIDITALSNQWKDQILSELPEMGKDIALGLVYTTATMLGIGIGSLILMRNPILSLTPTFVGSAAIISTASITDAEFKNYNSNILKKKGYLTGLLTGYLFVENNIYSFPTEAFLTILPLYFSGPAGVMIEGVFERIYCNQKHSEGNTSIVYRDEVNPSNTKD